jgi:hypothetical protein
MSTPLTYAAAQYDFSLPAARFMVGRGGRLDDFSAEKV